MLLLAGHVPHQVVDELVHLLHILSSLRFKLETDHIICHLHDHAPLAVVVLGGVPHLHGVLQVQPLCCLLKLLPILQESHSAAVVSVNISQCL